MIVLLFLSPFLAGFDPTTDWRLIVDLASVLIMLIFALRPQPPLHKQYADSEEFKKHKEEIWVIVNGLRLSIATIQTDIATIRTLREANGERLAEVNESLDALVIQVARLNERTERFHQGAS